MKHKKNKKSVSLFFAYTIIILNVCLWILSSIIDFFITKWTFAGHLDSLSMVITTDVIAILVMCLSASVQFSSIRKGNFSLAIIVGIISLLMTVLITSFIVSPGA